MADITMSLNDTLELDTIIKESADATVPITVADGTEGTDFDLDGIQTHTGIFNPTNSGTYNINIKGQELTVKVTKPSNIPDGQIYLHDDCGVTINYKTEMSRELLSIMAIMVFIDLHIL